MHKKCLPSLMHDDFCIPIVTDKVVASPATKDFATMFEANPADAISTVISSGLIEGTSVSIAKFLFEHREELNPAVCGDFISSEKQAEILKAFVDIIDFNGLDFEMSLRRLLRSMNIPGEAQKIERVMTCFGQHFMTVFFCFTITFHQE